MVVRVAHRGDEALELAALHADRAADVYDSQPVAGDLPLEAASGAAQLTCGLVQGEQQGVG
jgi:hypothetical protein